jgi:hypothetical protein
MVSDRVGSLRLGSDSPASTTSWDHPYFIPKPDVPYPHRRLVSLGIPQKTSTSIRHSD